MLSAVLHPDVFQFLRTDIGSTFQSNIWDCINKLRQQKFDGGLQVKRLRGFSKRVWEARINRASRLIFTYNKSRQPQTGQIEVYIAVQDICVDHDDVSRLAARERTPDTTWLDAEVVSVVGNIECNLIDLPQSERDAVDFAQLEDEDLAISSDVIDELLGNIQWQIVDSLEVWQRAIIDRDSALHLKLTPEEYELANYTGDIFLKGSAGTGKTTVALHRLCHNYYQTWHSGKRLYIAYNPLLAQNVKEQL